MLNVHCYVTSTIYVKCQARSPRGVCYPRITKGDGLTVSKMVVVYSYLVHISVVKAVCLSLTLDLYCALSIRLCPFGGSSPWGVQGQARGRELMVRYGIKRASIMRESRVSP